MRLAGYLLIFSVFAILTAANTLADTTDIAGPVFGNWDSRHLEYHIAGDIWIPPDNSLTIMADNNAVSIIFDGNYRFEVQRGATLRINISEAGDTASNRVLLSSPDVLSSWKGLRFDNADLSTIIYKANIQFATQTALYIDSSDIEINNCNIVNNLGNSSVEGGGTYSFNSNVVIRDCLFEGNSAGYGGGLYCYRGNIVVENNIFYSNLASAGNGGGILFKHIQSGSFANNLLLLNQALLFGGGMAFSDTSTLAIEQNTFHKNIAEIGGGLVSAGYAQPTLKNCILWQDSINQVAGIKPELYVTGNGRNPIVKYSLIDDTLSYLDSTNIRQDPLFVNPSIFLNQADFNLFWAGIQSDSANMSPCIDAGDPQSARDPDSSRADMGAYPYYHPFHLLGILDIDTLKNIYSPFYVMAPCIVGDNKTLVIEPGTEIKFRYSSVGASVRLYNMFFGNSASLIAAGSPDSLITFTRYDTDAGWKGLEFENADSSYLDYVKIEYVDSASAIRLENSPIFIANSFFENNHGQQGGAICAYYSTLDCFGSNFRGNKAGDGGAIWIDAGVLNLQENIFAADSATVSGAALYIDNLFEAIINRNIFWMNNSAGDGGAIYCVSLRPVDRTKFTNNTFCDNRAGHWGGGVYASPGSAFAIENSIFWENLALDFGSRHIYIPSDTVTYSYCDLSLDISLEVLDDDTDIHDDPLFVDRDNGDFNLRLGSPCIERGDTNLTAYIDPDGTRTDIGAKYFPQGIGEIAGDITGKVVLASPDTFKVTADIFVGFGDTLIIEPGVTLNFMGVYDIIVENGGFLNCSGEYLIAESDTSINQVRITSFDTTTGWGSILIDNSDSSLIRLSTIEYSKNTAVKLTGCTDGVVIEGVTFKYNRCQTGPGALSIDGGFSIIAGNNFYHNHSQTNGGAVCVLNGADATLIRNIFRLNSASNFGGALTIIGCADSMSIFNNTCYDNHANTGGGFYISNCSPLILNDILWLNTANFGPELYVDAIGDSPYVDYCDIRGGYITGGDSVIALDPLFADPDNGDFRLTWASFPVEDPSKSPCIDAGYPDTSLFKDNDGTRIDIGAFSFDQTVLGFAYVPGDANMYNAAWPPAVIGSDVTYLVNYFRVLPTNPACLINDYYCAADVNADCRVIGSDVTRLVSYFRGLAAIEYCADYPPAWQTPADCPDQQPTGWPGCEIITLFEKTSQSRNYGK